MTPEVDLRGFEPLTSCLPRNTLSAGGRIPAGHNDHCFYMVPLVACPCYANVMSCRCAWPCRACVTLMCREQSSSVSSAGPKLKYGWN
jgi:hypothetical protein